MNFVSKLTLLSGTALLAGTLLSGCASTEQPVLSDNPAPPAMPGNGNASGPQAAPSQQAASSTSNENSAGTAGANATEMSTGLATNPASVNGNATDDVIPAGAARLQPGETVNISTSTGSELIQGPIGASTPQSCVIAEDGTIPLPLIGNVQAAGKTPGELQGIITKLYVPQYYVRLSVTVMALNRVYYVGGEVIHPGPEEYLGQTTVTKAIQAAGDFTQFASHKVWLNKSDGTRISVNVDKALKDSDSDPKVYPGDQIQVPRRYF